MTGDQGFFHSVRRIVPLAWPVLVGQVAVLGFSTIDTILVARYSATDLAALAVGSAIYITVFIGLMGVVLAISPIVGQLHGAKRPTEAGHQLHQAIWMALGLSLIGSAVLAFPMPFLALAKASPQATEKVRGYLLILAFSLPASLLFTVFRGFNTAVSRPKAVMALQVAALALKFPLSMALLSGMPAWGIPALGVQGCAVATLVAMWAQVLAAVVVLRLDRFYAPFELSLNRLKPMHAPSLKALLHLGLPIGLSVLIEVSGFAFMAVFIARLGDLAVAGHQLAANLISLMFMMPLALSNATSTLVAQSIGANDVPAARRLCWHGWQLTLAVALVMGAGVVALREPILRVYTDNPAVIAAALPLLAWVALFHAADAIQMLTALALRAWRIAMVPMVIYAVALWGVGMGGGYVLAFNVLGNTPPQWRGAVGFWTASTAGLVVAATALTLLLAWVLRRSAQPPISSAEHRPG